jgi:hypothetical protein
MSTPLHYITWGYSVSLHSNALLSASSPPACSPAHRQPLLCSSTVRRYPATVLTANVPLRLSLAAGSLVSCPDARAAACLP